jgi:hypothetical protein
MREWLVKWLTKPMREKEIYSNRVDVASPEEAVDKPRPKVRIAVTEALNGKMLEVMTYQRNNHGPDWKIEYYILEEGKPLAEQIAVVMTMRGMGV